jgi:hypothetical protein
MEKEKVEVLEDAVDAIVVNDIGMAAFLKVVKGENYSEVPYRDADSNKFVFKFCVSGDTFTQYRTEYLNSEYRKFDAEIKDLKKVLNTPSNPQI